MIFEYVNYGLDKLIHSHKKAGKSISFSNCVTIMKGILKGLSSIHKQNVAHRDLKPDNILVEVDSQNSDIVVTAVKIADFGQAKIIEPNSITNAYIQSKNYRAPEI